MWLLIKAVNLLVWLTIVGLVICVPFVPRADRIVVTQVDTEINGRFKGQQYGNPAGKDLVLILGQNTPVGQNQVSTPSTIVCQIKGRNRPAKVNYLKAVGWVVFEDLSAPAHPARKMKDDGPIRLFGRFCSEPRPTYICRQ